MQGNPRVPLTLHRHAALRHGEHSDENPIERIFFEGVLPMLPATVKTSEGAHRLCVALDDDLGMRSLPFPLIALVPVVLHVANLP